MGRNIPGDLTFQAPSCPLCGFHLDRGYIDSNAAWLCDRCQAHWGPDGTFYRWTEPDAPQCDDTTYNTWTHLPFRCMLAAGHDGWHKHPTQASWKYSTPKTPFGADL